MNIGIRNFLIKFTKNKIALDLRFNQLLKHAHKQKFNNITDSI